MQSSSGSGWLEPYNDLGDEVIDKYIQYVTHMVSEQILEDFYIFLVHGFNLWDGGYATIDQLEPILVEAGATIDKDEMDYGHYGILDIRIRNGENRRRLLHRMAKAFEKAIKSGKKVVVIAHSNGPHFTNLALRMLPIVIQNKIIVIYISAAMNKKTEPTLVTKAELNLITPHDGWVKASSYIPFFAWGRRGARGYSGKSSKVSNWIRKEIKRHSDWFKTQYLFMTLYFCMKYMKENTE